MTKKSKSQKNNHKDFWDYLYLIVIFYGIFVGLFYVKNTSKAILFLLLCILAFYILYGVLTNFILKFSKRSHLLFKGVSLFMLSVSCLGINLTMIYLYIKYSTYLLVSFIVGFYFLFILASILNMKRTGIENMLKKQKKGVKIAGYIAGIGSLGYVIGFIFSKTIGQYGIYLILTIITWILVCLFTNAGVRELYVAYKTKDT